MTTSHLLRQSLIVPIVTLFMQASSWAETRPAGQSGPWEISVTTDASGKTVSASMTLSDKADRTIRVTEVPKQSKIILDVSGDWSALDGYLQSTGKKKIDVYMTADGKPSPDASPDVATVFEDEGGQTFLRISESYADEPSGLQDLVRNGGKVHIKLPKGAPWVFSLTGSHAAHSLVEKKAASTAKPAQAAAAKPQVLLSAPPYETIMEGLKIAPTKSMNYAVRLKKGQTVYITLHDKTKQLQGTFNAMEFKPNKELTVKVTESRDYSLDVFNPTGNEIRFSLDVSAQ